MKKKFGKFTALIVAAALILPSIPVLADEEVNLGNMFGATTFNVDGTVTLDSAVLDTGTGATLSWETLSDGPALKATNLGADSGWGSKTVKRIWFGETNHQYLVSAKVKTVNAGDTTNAWFVSSNSSNQKDKVDSNYGKAYNTDSSVAANVNSDGWTEIYGLCSLVSNNSAGAKNGVHIEIRVSDAKDVYIKDFNVVETSELDNLLVGQLDPTFENTTALYKNSSSRATYDYSAVPLIKSENNAQGANHYVELSGFTDNDGVFGFKIPVSAGKKYIVGMDVKLPLDAGEDTPQASLSGQWLDDAVVNAESSPELSTTLWKRVSCTIVSNISDIATVNLRVAGISNGSVLVDNIYMKEVSADQLYIVSTVPLDKAVSVSVTQKFTVKFSGAVSSFTEDNISVTGIKSDEASDDDIAVSSVTAMENNTYEIALSGVDYECKYTVELKNISGIADKSISFVTEAAPEPDNNLIADANYDFEEEIASENGYPGHCALQFKGNNVSATSVEGNIILPAYHNEHYASVTGRNDGADGIRFVFAPTTEVGKYYRASAWVRLPERTEEKVTAYITIGNFGQNTVKPSAADGAKSELKSYEWVEVSHIFEVIPKTGAVEPYTSSGMHIGIVTSHKGDIHLDNVRVEEYTPQPLAVTETVPAPEAEGVQLGGFFSVTFNNPIQSGLKPEQIAINNGAVISAVTKSEYANTYSLTIDNLCYSTEYKIEISDLTDTYGGTLQSYEYSFTTSARPAAAALIENPGFEAAQNNKWYYGGGGYSQSALAEHNGECHWCITSEDSYSGDYSIKSSGEKCGCQLYYNGIPVERNKQYVFSFAAKPNTTANVYLRQQTQTGAPAFEETRTALTSSGKWERHTVLFNSLENDYVRIYVGHNGSGTNYYDDFVVAKYETPMNYAYSSVEDGETDVHVNINSVTIAMTNIIDESERTSIIDNFTIDNGAGFASASVVSDGSVIELVFDDILKNNTTYTINCGAIADAYGIESSESSITFTTAPEIIVKQEPSILETTAKAVVKNCTDAPVKAPVLIYAEYDENNEIACVRASDMDDEIPAFTEYTCTISAIPVLDTGHTAMLYLVKSQSDTELLTEPVGTMPVFTQTDVYQNRANPQPDTVTVGGIAVKNSKVLIAILKPLDTTKNADNVAAYSPYLNNKLSVQNLLGESDTVIHENNIQSYIYHFVAAQTDENGNYSVTLPLVKTADKTVYGVLVSNDGFDGDMAAIYMPSAESYGNAVSTLDAGNSEANLTSVLDNFASDMGISLESPVYNQRKSNIITALKSEYPAGGYTDYTNEAEGSFRNDFQKVLAFYERQAEALAAINSASNDGLTAVLTQYSDVLGEYGGTLLNYSAKYAQYGEVNVNRQLIGTQYSSMQEFVDKFNTTVYKPLVTEEPRPSGGSGGGGGTGASFEVFPQLQPTASSERFSDLGGYDWAKDAIIKLADRGIINGMGDGSFNPGEIVTREQFVKMLVLAFGIDVPDEECDFSDTVSGSWYTPYISAAYKSGIVKGISDTEFGVGSSITRQDMAVMIKRACDLAGKSLTKSNDVSFDDSHTVSDYAASAVDSLAKAGIINGVSDGIIAPLENATRAQVAVILDRLG